jgi:FAD/FMN-containing dehydrogenase
MWQDFYKLVTTAPAKGKPPISQDYPYYALIESLGADRESDTERFNAALESALEQELIVDAAISQSDADCHAFWSLRDDVEQVIHGGLPVVFDISLPISTMEGFVAGLRDQLPGEIGDHKLWVYGHMGDGNLHVNVQVKAQDYMEKRPKIEALVYRGVKKCHGSVSAEHGIGLEKKPYLSVSRNAAELAVMRTIKQALDPKNLLNPGKVL